MFYVCSKRKKKEERNRVLGLDLSTRIGAYVGIFSGALGFPKRISLSIISIMALVSSFASWRSLSSLSSSASSMLRRISSLSISSSTSSFSTSSSSSSSVTFLRNTSWQKTDRKPQMSIFSLPQLTQQTQRRRYSTASPPPGEEATRLALNNISSTSGISQVFVPRELNFDSVPVYNWKLEQVDSIAIPRSVFGSPLRTDILHR
jgi:hypothetical protein